MSTLTIIKFIKFVRSQGDKEINHSCWKTCAVGGYLKSEGIHVNSVDGHLPDIVSLTSRGKVLTFVTRLEAKLLPCGTSLYDYLNYLDDGTYSDIIEAINHGTAQAN